MYLCGSSSSQFQSPLPQIATIQPRRVHTRARAACVANSGSWVPSVGLRSGVHRLCWACPLDLQISPPLLLWGGPWPEVPSGEQPLGGRRETGHSFSSFCGCLSCNAVSPCVSCYLCVYFSLFSSPSLSLPSCLSLPPPFFPHHCILLSLYPFFPPFSLLSLPPSASFFFAPLLSLSTSMSISMSMSFSIFLTHSIIYHVSVCLSVYLSIHPFTCISIHFIHLCVSLPPFLSLPLSLLS